MPGERPPCFSNRIPVPCGAVAFVGMPPCAAFMALRNLRVFRKLSSGPHLRDGNNPFGELDINLRLGIQETLQFTGILRINPGESNVVCH